MEQGGPSKYPHPLLDTYNPTTYPFVGVAKLRDFDNK